MLRVHILDIWVDGWITKMVYFNIIQQKNINIYSRLNISMDELKECVTANSLLEHLMTRLQKKEQWQSKGTADRWREVLNAADLPNIQAVVSFVLSIPSSTGFVERIFSFMKSKWTDVRNKCSAEVIRSELIVNHNYKMQLLTAELKKKYKWKK